MALGKTNSTILKHRCGDDDDDIDMADLDDGKDMSEPVSEARRRCAEWKSEMPLSEKKKADWEEREREMLREMLREEQENERDAQVLEYWQGFI